MNEWTGRQPKNTMPSPTLSVGEDNNNSMYFNGGVHTYALLVITPRVFASALEPISDQ